MIGIEIFSVIAHSDDLAGDVDLFPFNWLCRIFHINRNSIAVKKFTVFFINTFPFTVGVPESCSVRDDLIVVIKSSAVFRYFDRHRFVLTFAADIIYQNSRIINAVTISFGDTVGL